MLCSVINLFFRYILSAVNIQRNDKVNGFHEKVAKELMETASDKSTSQK